MALVEERELPVLIFEGQGVGEGRSGLQAALGSLPGAGLEAAAALARPEGEQGEEPGQEQKERWGAAPHVLETFPLGPSDEEPPAAEEPQHTQG